MTRWRDLIVTDDAGNTGETLGSMVASCPANLDSADWTSVDGIISWPGFMISEEGEAPAWDTPAREVDWSGFGDAMRIATGDTDGTS